MTSISWLKTASAGVLMALLAACGGGGGASSTPAPEVPWASPAVFVTPGQSSEKYSLQSCTKRINGYNENTSTSIPEVNQQLVSATLSISADGVASLSASVSPTGTVSTQWSLEFGDAQYSSWSVEGSAQTPSYYIDMSQSNRSYKYMNVYSNADEGSLEAYENSYSAGISTNTYYRCNLATPLALKVNADQARAAKNLGTAAGVTTFDNYYVDGRIESAKAFWSDNRAMADYSNLRFDLATGQLASSSSSSGTYTNVSLALPTAAGEYGAYSENIERNSSFYNRKDAKSICLSFESPSRAFDINATAYDNKFMPRRGDSFMMPTGMESPHGKGGGCNNDR
jgi:hypothetical protein